MARRSSLAVVAVLLVVVGAVAASRVSRDPSAVDRARQLAADDHGFTTATEAGVTFTRVSRLLEDAGEQCRRESGSDDAGCAGLFAGAGYARVSAVGVLRCTRPGVFNARRTLEAYLASLSSDDRAPEPPAVVACA